MVNIKLGHQISSLSIGPKWGLVKMHLDAISRLGVDAIALRRHRLITQLICEELKVKWK